MKKILIIVAVLAMLNTYSCSEKTKEINIPAPTVEEPSETDEKTTLNIATTIDLSQVKGQIINKMSCDVNIKFYPGSDETDPFEMLHLDMISGEDIDVVYSSTDDMIQLIKNDYMTDIYPLMEQSETLKKEDFLPNVLAGLEIDSKLPAICDEWILFTAVAKTENVGENMENWTPEQAFEAFNNMPEDMTFLDNEWKEYDRLNYFIKRVAFDSVDYRNNTCDFGGAFMETLDGINNLPAFQPYEFLGNDNLIKNRSLVSDIYLFGINSTLTQQIYAGFGGADITFVGYPSETGKGYVTDVFSMLGILETSSAKQEGYEFIELMLNDNSINKDLMYSMPITEKNLTDQLNESKYNQSSVNCPQYLPDGIEQVQISEKALKQAVEYVRNVEFEPYTSYEVERIVSEEYHKCYSGEISSQQCADNLNNRISLYLSETN
ncbi:MAG: extracellular solute-binding protein [Prevotella sp.]|nr:extracellular solute-binding protein [Alistipes senegalensis]MCM1358877.1 extracellular solute-binding protein [Prevotella sp.]MCM1473542.1 extracellular solute-binding protein [Muribaculaceae bacterium]